MILIYFLLAAPLVFFTLGIFGVIKKNKRIWISSLIAFLVMVIIDVAFAFTTMDVDSGLKRKVSSGVKVVSPSQINNYTNLLTVTSESGSTETFDLLITGKKGKKDVFFKREQSVETPYELEIEPGDYSIVIHRSSEEGIVNGKIEMLVDGKVKASAQSSQQISLLSIDEENNLSATGM